MHLSILLLLSIEFCVVTSDYEVTTKALSVGYRSVLELHCSGLYGLRSEEALLTAEKCTLDENGQLIAIVANADSSDQANYTCVDNDQQRFTTFHVNVTNVKRQKSDFDSNASTLTDDALGDCGRIQWLESRNLPTTQIWLKNGELLCRGDEIVALCNQTLSLTIPESSTANQSIQRTKKRSQQFLAPLITILMALFVIVIVVVGFCYMRRKRSEINDLMKLYHELVEPHDAECLVETSKSLREQVDLLPFDRSYEIRLERIAIRKVVSKGRYGRVYMAILQPKILGTEAMEVNVKGPEEAAKYEDVRALADEAKVMMAIGMHPNVLCLVGVVIENMIRGGDLYVVVEHTVHNLKAFLHKRKDYFINELTDSNDGNSDESSKRKISNSKKEKIQKTLGPSITTSLLCSFAYQIANGMEFLAKKHCVHRDLAARNVLLKKNRTVRIADFGEDRQWDYQYLMQSIDYASPFKIMARESISESRFSEKTDVWSYGILLWEIFTLGDDPHRSFSSAQKLGEFYQKGGRLSRPQYMPANVAQLMSNCWEEDPNTRPTFANCKKITQKILKEQNPRLYTWLEDELNEQVTAMRKFADWRDGPVAEDADQILVTAA